ncbi:hypothetical protein EDB84DRAFT_998296 [Lactarius hengduanensis]|nr:hypothetical protein EDB84DRAFT_998296 [Lactarius hengduanensis]
MNVIPRARLTSHATTTSKGFVFSGRIGFAGNGARQLPPNHQADHRRPFDQILFREITARSLRRRAVVVGAVVFLCGHCSSFRSRFIRASALVYSPGAAPIAMQPSTNLGGDFPAKQPTVVKISGAFGSRRVVSLCSYTVHGRPFSEGLLFTSRLPLPMLIVVKSMLPLGEVLRHTDSPDEYECDWRDITFGYIATHSHAPSGPNCGSTPKALSSIVKLVERPTLSLAYFHESVLFRHHHLPRRFPLSNDWLAGAASEPALRLDCVHDISHNRSGDR